MSISKEVEEAIKRKIEAAIGQGFDDKYGFQLGQRIVKRTKLGYGVDPETGKGVRLKPLAEITKKVRRNQARIFGVKGGGKIVITDGTEEKGLKPKAKKIRKESFRNFFGEVTLSADTTPGRSNLTATGQLLASVIAIPLKLKGAFGYRFTIDDKRGLDMFGQKSKIGNKELNKYVSKDRPWFGFTKAQRNEISRDIRQFIIKYIK